MLKTPEKNCANCGQEIEQFDDDTPKKNFCKSCESPNCNPVQRRAFFKKHGGVPQPEDTTIPLPTQLQLIFGKLDFKYFLDDENKIFKPQLCAQTIRRFVDLKYDRTSNIFYYYDPDKKKWRDNAETFIGEICGIALGEENKQSHYTNILYCLKTLSTTDVKFSKDLIGLENGLFDPTTKELKSFTPKEMVVNSLPVKYKPELGYEDSLFVDFIKNVLPTKEDRMLLQEFSGFLLLPDYRFHYALWIHGPGRNGKGVWMRTLYGNQYYDGIIGKENCSSIGLEELDGKHRFSTVNLMNKMFNPCNEPPTHQYFSTELFKKVTGQDPIYAEIKNSQRRVNFINRSKFVIIGNRFAKVKDPTVAFMDRMLFLVFPKYIEKQDRIPNLENTWLCDPIERSKILNWSLEGKDRLLANKGQFTESKTQKETQILFQRVSDPFLAFINEIGVFDKQSITLRDVAYEKFKNYCEFIGVDPDSLQKFTCRMKETPKITITQVKGKGRAWKGIGFKDLPVEEDEGYTEYTRNTDITSYKKSETQNNIEGETGVFSDLSVYQTELKVVGS